MTVIAGAIGKGSVWIGGDRSLTESGTSQLTHGPSKVFRNGEVVIGSAGSARVGQLLQYILVVPKRQTKTSADRYICGQLVDSMRECLSKAGALTKKDGIEQMAGSLLVGYRGSLYMVDDEFFAYESSDGYDAVGSGSSVALGALAVSRAEPNTRSRVLAALRAAEHHDSAVRGPFDVVSLEPVIKTKKGD